MAVGRKCSAVQSKDVCVIEGDKLGFLRYTRVLGRKRIVILSNNEASPNDSTFKTPLKKRCGERVIVGSDKSPIESLPQDILIRILCGVQHDDMNQLVHVSKSIKEAAEIAKQWHFAYNTPTKKRPLRTPFLDDFGDCDDIDTQNAPNAPKQTRSLNSKISGKNLVDISVVLFTSPDE